MMIQLIVSGGVVIGLSAAAMAQDAVIGRASIAPFFEAAKTQRVDVVMLGDSNQVHAQDGWDHGWQKNMADRYGLYATGLMPCGENSGYTMGVGYGYQTFFTAASGVFAYTDAPPALETLMVQGIGLNPQTYMRVPEGASVAATVNEGLVLLPGQPIDVDAALRFHATYGTFTSADPGSFRLAVRNQSGPFGNIVVGPAISTNAGVEAAAMASLDIPAGVRGHALNFRFVPASGPETQDIDGPFLGFYTRAEMLERTAGVSVSTLYALGDQSARDAAHSLNLATDAQLSLYFSSIRALQGPEKHVLVRVCFGVNDRVEPLISVGTKQVLPGWTPEAYGDNLQAMIDRLTHIWTLSGWPETELSFVFTITPPILEPDDAQLMGYRDAAEQVALVNPRTAVVRFERLTNVQECTINGWYDKPWDRNHLSLKGYEALGLKEIVALTACTADADGSGSLDINDFIEFQTQFAVGAAWADFDDSGSLDIDDFIVFQTYFALGC